MTLLTLRMGPDQDTPQCTRRTMHATSITALKTLLIWNRFEINSRPHSLLFTNRCAILRIRVEAHDVGAIVVLGRCIALLTEVAKHGFPFAQV